MKTLIFFTLFIFFHFETFSQTKYYNTTLIEEFLNDNVEKYSSKVLKYYINDVQHQETDSLTDQLVSLTKYLNSRDFPKVPVTTEDSLLLWTHDDLALQAMLAFNELILRNVGTKKIYYYGATLESTLGYYKKAIQYYTYALIKNDSFFKNDYLIHGDRGITKFKAQDYFGAISDLTITIDWLTDILDKNDSDKTKNYLLVFLTTRGRSYLLLKEYNKAIEDFSLGISLNPYLPENYFLRGIAYISINKKEQGCNDLSKAGELGYEQAYRAIKELCNN